MKKNSLYDIEYFQKIKDAQILKKKNAKRRQFILIGLALLVILYLVTPLSRINSISIIGNSRYNQAQIQEFASVNKGDLTLFKPAFLIKSKLENAKVFKEVSAKKSWLGALDITIKENKLLFYEKDGNKVIFYDEANNNLTFSEVETKKYQALVPELSSKITAELKEKMVEKLSELDESVLNEISQIIHTPKSYDDQQFRFVMSHEKEIYINTNLEYIVKVGANYHNFAANTQYKCSFIEYLDTENKAIVKKCK